MQLEANCYQDGEEISVEFPCFIAIRRTCYVKKFVRITMCEVPVYRWPPIIRKMVRFQVTCKSQLLAKKFCSTTPATALYTGLTTFASLIIELN